MKYKWLLLLVVGVNALGLFGSIMEPDGALYAYIAKQMAQHGDFINLYNNTDWLDKPHFPFWMAALSFKIFGISSFAYKLPAFLFWLAGLGYLYKLGKELYNRQTARVAVLVYATAFQSIIALYDVRAEHYLTALTLAATYYLYKMYVNGSMKYVLPAALFSACAVMTKGIFFLATIVSGTGILILIKKEWRQFANYRWYVYLLLTLLFIAPELYCLYVQFDLHPEKMVYGKTHVSGLRFFFWDSQFGRFFNTGPIKGEGDLFFFFHTVLWAFLPWSVLLYAAIVRLVREKPFLAKPAQWIILGSAAFTFLVFSLSKFQLPHYLIVLFPQFSLLCADYLVSKQKAKGIHSFLNVQRVLLAFVVIAITALCILFGLPYPALIILIATLVAAAFFYASRKPGLPSVMRLGIGFCVVLHLFLILSFYPALLQYQSGMVAAQWFNTHIKSNTIGLFETEDFSMKFYANATVMATDSLLTKAKDGSPVLYYFGYKKAVDRVQKTGASITELQSFANFHISKLTSSFLNKQTRVSQLDSTVIFKINP